MVIPLLANQDLTPMLFCGKMIFLFLRELLVLLALSFENSDLFANDEIYSLSTVTLYIIAYICFQYEEKQHILFSNNEVFDQFAFFDF